MRRCLPTPAGTSRASAPVVHDDVVRTISLGASGSRRALPAAPPPRARACCSSRPSQRVPRKRSRACSRSLGRCAPRGDAARRAPPRRASPHPGGERREIRLLTLGLRGGEPVGHRLGWGGRGEGGGEAVAHRRFVRDRARRARVAKGENSDYAGHCSCRGPRTSGSVVRAKIAKIEIRDLYGFWPWNQTQEKAGEDACVAPTWANMCPSCAPGKMIFF